MLQSEDRHTTVALLGSDSFRPDERRSDARSVPVLRSAILHTHRGSQLCLVRNISQGGFMAQIFCDLDRDDTVTIELSSERSARGRVVWRRDDLIGVQFSKLADLSELLSNHLPYTFLPLAVRAPRVEMNVPARLNRAGHWHPVSLANIAQSGARLELTATVKPGDLVVLTVPRLASTSGVVCWHKNDCAGMAFSHKIPFADLARWVADNRRMSSDNISQTDSAVAERQPKG